MNISFGDSIVAMHALHERTRSLIRAALSARKLPASEENKRFVQSLLTHAKEHGMVAARLRKEYQAEIHRLQFGEEPTVAAPAVAYPAADSPNQCPRCRTVKSVMGLMGGFWVSIGPNGDTIGDWADWQSCTELTTERQCQECGHEWEY